MAVGRNTVAIVVWCEWRECGKCCVEGIFPDRGDEGADGLLCGAERGRRGVVRERGVPGDGLAN